MIKSVFTDNIMYTSESTHNNNRPIVITNCSFWQTAYGSVIITKKSGEKIELYPSIILHIIFKKI